MIITAAVAVVFPTAAQATQWVLIAKNDDAARYIDADAMIREQAIATIWLKTEYASKGKSGEASAVEKWMHDCANRRSKLLALTLYKANGSVIESAELPRYRQEWKPIVTSSIGETIHQRVCGIGLEHRDVDPPRVESTT